MTYTAPMQDETTGRFSVVPARTGRYYVLDTITDLYVRYLGRADGDLSRHLTMEPETEWNNYYSARGYAQRLARAYP